MYLCYYESMGRSRFDILDVKERVTVRLRRRDLEKIKKEGTYQEIIEKAVQEYLKKISKSDKENL